MAEDRFISNLVAASPGSDCGLGGSAIISHLQGITEVGKTLLSTQEGIARAERNLEKANPNNGSEPLDQRKFARPRKWKQL